MYLSLKYKQKHNHQVSTAYAILSDPNKKRQYDLHGDDGDSLPEFSTINVEDLGTMGRLFGALISKAGIPVPTDIDRKVLAAAEHISRGETNIPGFPVPEPTVLQYGQVCLLYTSPSPRDS